ncbi:hypothetical protein GCM10010468_31200 [Actinocorallia longicatena]|uniref:Uncharacterized protein n=1 Tax=Actinocorallia longicatena TaxID=111803 RepID=A0ABP6Q9U9_9ACTN
MTSPHILTGEYDHGFRALSPGTFSRLSIASHQAKEILDSPNQDFHKVPEKPNTHELASPDECGES